MDMLLFNMCYENMLAKWDNDLKILTPISHTCKRLHWPPKQKSDWKHPRPHVSVNHQGDTASQ